MLRSTRTKFIVLKFVEQILTNFLQLLFWLIWNFKRAPCRRLRWIFKQTFARALIKIKTNQNKTVLSSDLRNSKKVFSEDDNSDFSGIYDQPRGSDSPMEIKNHFVRHGFGRVSTNSKSSSYPGSDQFNSLDGDMGQSEVEENHSKTTVKQCISKFNSNSTPAEGKIS